MADHDAKFARARRSVAREQELLADHERALKARNQDVREAYDAAPPELSDNAVARALDLNPSTFRSIVPREQREQRARSRAR